MRILAVRGRNLASLADPFELDLAAEPLAGAGIFAVTGETGAGKSTILDALCLALYGDYPRLAAGGREEAPDPGGVALGGHDRRPVEYREASTRLFGMVGPHGRAVVTPSGPGPRGRGRRPRGRRAGTRHHPGGRVRAPGPPGSRAAR